MIELWVRDEYGQASIVERSDSMSDLMKSAFDTLESENFDNALTDEETSKNWTCYMPVVVNKEEDGFVLSYLYSGSSNPGTYDFLKLSNSGKNEKVSIDSLNLRMLLGFVGGEHIFAKNGKNQDIKKIDDYDLRLKSFLFFREQ